MNFQTQHMVLKGFELFGRTNVFASCVYKMGGGCFPFVGFFVCMFGGLVWGFLVWFLGELIFIGLVALLFTLCCIYCYFFAPLVLCF